MKYKTALYIGNNATTLDEARPLGEWAEGVPESYTRVTEYVEVDYPDRPVDEYIADQISGLREKQKEIQADAKEKVDQLEDFIRTLAAIEDKSDEIG